MLSTVLSFVMVCLPLYPVIDNPDCIPPDLCGIEQTGMFDPCAILDESRIDRLGYTDPTTIPYSVNNPDGFKDLKDVFK